MKAHEEGVCGKAQRIPGLDIR